MTSADAPRSDAGREGAPSLAVAGVRPLMERHGLPRYGQSAWLADALGLSYSQAHRRMTGASPWTLEELAKVAALFGESLADVVAVTQTGAAVPGTIQRRRDDDAVSDLAGTRGVAHDHVDHSSPV